MVCYLKFFDFELLIINFEGEYRGSSDEEDLFASDDNESDEEWMNSNVRMR